MSSPSILYVDDEPVMVDEYRIGLEQAGFNVKFCRTLDEVEAWLEANSESLDCVVLDVMLPNRRYDDGLAEHGLLTGLLFYEELRPLLGDSVPIILLTNNADPLLLERTKHDARAQVIRKQAIFYHEFAQIVREALGLTTPESEGYSGDVKGDP